MNAYLLVRGRGREEGSIISRGTFLYSRRTGPNNARTKYAKNIVVKDEKENGASLTSNPSVRTVRRTYTTAFMPSATYGFSGIGLSSSALTSWARKLPSTTFPVTTWMVASAKMVKT